MFERYTEKARRVIFFARHEASDFGSPYIGPEFLLLGMLREDQNVVTRWLGKGDWKAIFRDEIANYIDTGPKLSTSVDLPLTEEAKRVLAYAAEEAERLKHEHIGTEHLFLGLLREPQSNTGKMLISHGIDIKTVRETIANESARSGFGTGSGTAGAIAQGRAFQVQMVREESDKPVHLLWGARLPAVGELISLESDDDESGVYQVVKVDWKVTTNALGSHSLTKALVHVRELKALNE